MIEIHGLDYSSHVEDDNGTEKRVHLARVTLGFDSQEEALNFAPWFLRRGMVQFRADQFLNCPALPAAEALVPVPAPTNVAVHVTTPTEAKAPATRKSRGAKAAEVAPAAPAESGRTYPVSTESGEVTVHDDGKGNFTAQLGVVTTVDTSEDGAVASLLNAVEVQTVEAHEAKPAPVVAAPPVVTVVPPQASSLPAAAPPPVTPAAAPVTPAVAAPADLLPAQNFRHVLEWMLRNGFNTVESIEAQCAVYAEVVPAIKRQGTDGLTGRIKRGLEVLAAS
jgi:hypothetical protein